MYTISKLCNEYKLSRSALLYYDKIGLLIASSRSKANYRLYSEMDKIRLNEICAFREAGVPLEQIKEILAAKEVKQGNILEKRLDEINKEIRYMRLQQKLIVEMLKARSITDKNMFMDISSFISILKSAGLEDEVLHKLHIQYEKNSPEGHQFFLEFLGLPAEDIKQIRDSSKK